VQSERIIPIFVGEKLGQAKAYNDVFAIVDAPYTVWLSDDNEVVNNGLDRALAILKRNETIGLVGLKTKDIVGPFASAPYIGGISPMGILNVNQGMLPTCLLRELGGFSEAFRDYGIDPALTAEVLFAGHKVAYTKNIVLHHYRNWSEDPTSENYQWLRARHAASAKLYMETYGGAGETLNLTYRLKTSLAKFLKQILRRLAPSLANRNSFFRDVFNSLSGKHINCFDPLLTLGKAYHLVQQVKMFDRRPRPKITKS
jgi:GT2 family glycosyltransferase